MIFATGITENYESHALPMLRSAYEFKIELLVYLVNYHVPYLSMYGHPWIEAKEDILSYVLPKHMLQHGGFTQFDHRPDDTVVAFLDADARFQRSFTQEEYDLMTPRPGEFIIGRNKTDPNQPLLDEAKLVSIASEEELIKVFPGCDRMICRNFGFVVARNGDWKKLYASFNEKWPDVLKRFSNPAQVQWLCMYIVQRDFKLGPELPLNIHAHGHHGLAPGVYHGNNTWFFNDKVVAFAHNLDWLK